MPVYEVRYAKTGFIRIQAGTPERAEEILRDHFGADECNILPDTCEELCIDETLAIGPDDTDAELRDDAAAEE